VRIEHLLPHTVFESNHPTLTALLESPINRRSIVGIPTERLNGAAFTFARRRWGDRCRCLRGGRFRDGRGEGGRSRSGDDAGRTTPWGALSVRVGVCGRAARRKRVKSLMRSVPNRVAMEIESLANYQGLLSLAGAAEAGARMARVKNNLKSTSLESMFSELVRGC
jgi:hypothetical protein